MINLLPEGVKTDIRYARRNSILLRWLALILLSLAGVVILTGGGRFYLGSAISSRQKSLEVERQSFNPGELESANKQLQEISNNVKLANSVLQREVLFSSLLRRLGAVTPKDVVLTGLSIDSVQGALLLNIGAKSVDAATQFQVNVQDPANKIFDKADIENIDCSATPDSSQVQTDYPCTARVKALFSANNPFLFISKNAGT